MTSISSTDKLPLSIEAGAHNTNEKEDGVVTIDVDGTPIKLDKLGPMIINGDGTISRITNWAEMGEIERNRAVRLMVKRNHSRLKKLAQEHGDSGDEQVSALKEA
ncbi:hypothetical protein CC85DRAFT_271032 [Cutaneotrichosporon oleaginosum]|uniref:Uncharacterized protein n=1 Tax=Cutaneotrichosporon oleaginosum TaxID=879819 RepID=A0A0J0XU80_9TREE|nr:uncharacterized protein CC85DRAFT_271032 [Cutaneotrichosporon oleaginosum]KLT44620.1 hypothetical protein CC85DRAFT_271032 [Cutaneotrichosporon oleaginosum]TXT13865.1 hypothetical protein COLE_00058 [Cutaneotrichosporon oleaginosum]